MGSRPCCRKGKHLRKIKPSISSITTASPLRKYIFLEKKITGKIWINVGGNLPKPSAGHLLPKVLPLLAMYMEVSS